MLVTQKMPMTSVTLGMAILLSALILEPTLAQESDQMPSSLFEPPDHWQQVEVIIFEQKKRSDEERPPQNYDLQFPKSLLRLVDVNALAEQRKNAIEGALLPAAGEANTDQLVNTTNLIPTVRVQDPVLGNDLADNIATEEAEWSITDNTMSLEKIRKDYTPEYENPFEMLDVSVRDLNDSARVLRRRGQNVIFHEAWRFVAQQDTEEPWVLINAGNKLDHRAEVEGALRFYKSRFLHFQSDLWRIKFATDEQTKNTKAITLPKVPSLIRTTDSPLLWRIFYKNAPHQGALADNYDNPVDLDDWNTEHEPEGKQQNSINQAAIGPIKSVVNTNQVIDIVGDNYMLQSFDPVTEKQNLLNHEQEYAVAEVWPINLEKRIEEDKVYYLDHPEIGIIVMIKPYQPTPINIPDALIDGEIRQRMDATSN
ncbi:MAG: CsiV family protein [Porticoccaceae bacterium]|nr:CsiV family protein [Porticoccaceae bacterium]MDG1474445.1 CsiV family protein [Porticoccaceae bacterium]